MIDDRTSHMNLPLPHEENFLPEDVARLRQVITALDAKFLALDTLLDSDDVTLDTVVELVAAIKQNRTSVSDLLIGKADQTALNAMKVEHEETQVLADGQTVVDLTYLTSTAGATVFIEGIRLKKNQWSADGVIANRLTLSKTYPAGHEITVVRRQGGV